MVETEELTRKEILKKADESSKDCEIFISFDLSKIMRQCRREFF